MADELIPVGQSTNKKKMIDLGGYVGEVVAIGGTVATSDAWHPTVVSDTTADDSDKTFTVPASTEWQPLAITVDLTTTATAGNRQLAVLFTDDSDNVLASVRAGATQAASLTRRYVFALGMPDLLSYRDADLLNTPLPVATLPAGYKVRVYDNKAVAAAADDMTVRMLVMARSV